jgi:NlpC/P60 family putative phage cell wall peptidase
MISRTAILNEARDWIGTPYRHQASAKHAGCDCLGLVRGVWRACFGAEPETAPAYSPDWAERRGAETLFDAARRHLIEIDVAHAMPGDVLLFRMDAQSPIKHAAILDQYGPPAPSPAASVAGEGAGGPYYLIHAYWGRAVVRSRVAPWWRARLAAAFAFPGALPWPS